MNLTPMSSRASYPAARAAEPAVSKEVQEKLATQIVDNLISSPEFTKQALKRVGHGDELTINVNGQDLVKIHSEGPSIAERMIKGTRLGITATAEELTQVVNSDPAFGFRTAAMGIKTQVFNGVDQSLQDMADKAWLPMLRGAALALDTKQGVETFRNKDASMVDRIMEGVHVGTDVVGFVGALGYNVIPALKTQAGLLTAIGFAGDIASYSYRALQFLRERGSVSATDNHPQPPSATQGHISTVGQTAALKQALSA